MFKNKLVFKITLGYTLITLISLLIVSLLFINMFRENTFQNKEANMVNMGREIAKVAAPYLSQGNSLTGYKGFMELLDSFANARVWLVNRNGDALVMSKGEWYNIEESIPFTNTAAGNETIRKVINGQEVTMESTGIFYNEPMVTVGVPVYDAENKVLGGVFMHSPITGITGIIDKAFNYLIAGIILAILLSLLMGWVYSSIITKPLKLMNNAAIEMTRGNYKTRTDIRQNDEIGQLGSSLDLLSSKLDYTIDQLYQEKGKLNDIIASVSEGILAFDSNMNLINYNQALIKLFDYKQREDIERSVKEDLREQRLLEEFDSVINSGKSKMLTREWNIRKLKFILSPVKNNAGEIIGVVALIQDISESERLEQMRKEFVANVSHELRTPLTLIKGSVEALIDKAVTQPQEVEKYHHRILKEANGLERLVNDLMDLGRFQSGKFSLNFEKIEMKPLVLDTVNSFKTIVQSKGIEILFEAPENIPPVIADYDRLKQLLIIFLDNAVKYSNANTKIHIVMEVKEYVYVRIKDNGIGISKEDIPFVWERFYKVDKARSSPQMGTGLGLAIAKYLVDAHNGVMWLESELNAGTTVVLGLPYIKQ